MDYSPQAQIDRINAVKSSAERANQTCEKPASDTVKGDAATVVVVHTDAGGKRSDARLWISDKSGLPLKSEIRVDGGNEIAIVTDDFRYDHIEAPAGVK
jgi:outer membrane lipoprotein-sorting protein